MENKEKREFCEWEVLDEPFSDDSDSDLADLKEKMRRERIRCDESAHFRCYL